MRHEDNNWDNYPGNLKFSFAYLFDKLGKSCLSWVFICGLMSP